MIDTSISVLALNKSNHENLAGTLGMEFTELNRDYLKAKMPVNENTIQQLGFLSGGASAALAETTGSMAAYLSLDRKNFYCVGLDLNIHHLKTVTDGHIHATAEAVHLGKTTQVWQIKITNDSGELISMATLTMAILNLDGKMRTIIEKKLALLL